MSIDSLRQLWLNLGSHRYQVYTHEYDFVSNPDADIFDAIIANMPEEEANNYLTLLEQRKEALVAQEEAEKNNYKNKRREAYIASGLTVDKLIIDLWEYVVENRQEAALSSQAIRQQIKQQYPKE